MRAKVVTAFVPLKVKHLTADGYHELGKQLEGAVGADRFRFFDNFPLGDCWLAKENPPLVPASDTPADRYDTREDHARSNIVQHSRTQWALAALREDPSVDFIVWLDLGIMKQGAWLNNQITAAHVTQFIQDVEKLPSGIIPFPGIEERKPLNPSGNNWRFCGSTHIWPVQFLPEIDRQYKFYTREFIRKYGTIPLDLAVWPTVEELSGLPFRWYKAEYDATQLTNLRSVL
jgi:hypothetical protein